MADFTALKTAIQNAIKQNGNEEITGNLLQDVLLAIVTTLGEGNINNLINSLDAEVTARQQAVSAEAQARQQAVSAEAQARQLADSTLQGGINTVSAAITAINNAIGNGCVYAGIATPSSTPASGRVFYLALTAGTYTNYGGLEVPQGINILKNNGSTWLLDSFLGIDDAPTPSSNKLVKSGGVFNDIMTNGSAFDLSAYNNGTTYADLNAALTALNALPAAFKKGGMSMKYVQSSDNNYYQYFCNSQNFTTNISKWERMNIGNVLACNTTEKIAEVTSIDYQKIVFSSLTATAGWINESGERNNLDNGSLHYVIEISGRNKIFIRANENNAYYVFASAINNDGSWNNVTYRLSVNANTEALINAPTGAKYIIIGNRSNSSLANDYYTPSLAFFYNDIIIPHVNKIENEIKAAGVAFDVRTLTDCSSVDFSTLTAVDGWVGIDGNISRTDGSLHYVVPINGKKAVSIFANGGNPSAIIFASSVNEETGAWQPVGERVLVPKSVWQTVNVPTGALYLIVGNRSSYRGPENNNTPYVLSFYNEKISEIVSSYESRINWNYKHLQERTLIDYSEVDFSLFSATNGWVGSDGNIGNLDSGSLHYVVPIVSREKVSITAKPTRQGVVVFASTINNDGSWVKVNDRIFTTAGVETILNVPAGAKYIIIGNRANSTQVEDCYTPSLVSLYDETIKNKVDEIDSTLPLRLAGGLRISTYNIGRFSYGQTFESSVIESDYLTQLENYRSVIRRIGADVLFLDEYNDIFCADYQGQIKYAKDVIFGDFPVRHISEDISPAKYNISLFAWPFLQNITKKNFDSAAAGVRYYIEADYLVNGQTVKLINTHLPLDFNGDANAITVLQELITKMSSYDYVVISGDMNMVSSKTHFSYLTEAGYTIANCGQFGDFPTYNGREGVANRCIDNIAVKGFKMMNVRMIQTEDASDHYPIVCDIVMKNY